MEDGTGRVSKGGEQGCEEAHKAVGRRGCWVGGFGVQKPLKNRDATVYVNYKISWLRCMQPAPYCAIETTRAETKSLPDVL